MAKGYYKTKESVEEYVTLAEGVNGKQLINKLKNHLTPQSSLLELGSGPGSDWKILNSDYQVVGSDNSQEFLNYLNSSYPNGEFLELDAATLKTDKKFDGIYSNKVLHHLTNKELENSIKRQTEILNSNGIICHSFWNGEGSEVFKGLFVNYHIESGLRNFFKESFEIILLEMYAEFEESDSMVLIARKK